jgi:hypothetical protein
MKSDLKTIPLKGALRIYSAFISLFSAGNSISTRNEQQLREIAYLRNC